MVGQLPQNFTDQNFTERSNVNQYAFLKDIRLDGNQNEERTLLQEAKRRMIVS